MSGPLNAQDIPFLARLLKPSAAPGSLGRLGDFEILGIVSADPAKTILKSLDPLTDRPTRLALFAQPVENLDAARSKLLPGHDFLYPIHDLLQIENQPLVVMPQLAGASLAQALQTAPVSDLKQALRTTRELLAALAVGRDRGLLHGSLSPDNLFLESPGGHVRLLGTGWHLLSAAPGGDLATFMASGGTYTPSPEVAEGQPADQRSDIFAAGCLLYQMLSGQPPFPGSSPLAIIRSLALVEPQPIAQLSPAVTNLLAQLMAKQPQARPATARDAARLVKEVETGLASTAPTTAPAKTTVPDEIGLVPLEPEPPARPAPPKPTKPAAHPQEEDDLLIDFAEPVTPPQAHKGPKSAGDDLLIDLLPIDDTPARPTGPATHAPRKKAGKTEAPTGLKPGAAYTSMKVPLEWVYVADTPVDAIHLAGEAQRLLVRDQSGRVAVLSTGGELLASEQTPEPIRLSAADQAGQVIALILGKRSLVLMDWDLNLLAERQLHSEPVALAVDPLGLYIAASFQGNETRLYTRSGKPAGSFETRQPLAHMAFVPGSARLMGSTRFDQLICAELEQSKGSQLDAEVAWTQNTGVAIAHLHLIGGAAKILASCNNMGLQRLNMQGENEGTYQLGGTVLEAAADYPGRFFLASTLEGALMAVNANGSVIWEHNSGGPWRHLCMDPLGRFGLAASALGEVVLIDLGTEPRARVDNSKVKTITPGGGGAAGSTVRSAEWSLRVADDDENTTGTNLCVSDKPWRACLLDTRKQLTCFIADGDEAESVAPLGGSGRMLKTRDGWVAAASDRTLALVNLSQSETLMPELDLVQITHFDMRPAQYGLLIIQEGDRIGRATPAGRWVWRVQLPATAESLVLANDGYAALSLDNGQLLVLDSAGKGVGKWSAGEQEAVLVSESAARHEGRCRWVSLARQERLLRGHSLDAKPIWQLETPFAPWELVRTGQGVVVAANDGKAILYDDTGKPLASRRGGHPRTVFATAADGSAIALHADAGQVFCTRFDGSVLWRVPLDGEVSALALTSSGALVLAGGILSWVKHT